MSKEKLEIQKDLRVRRREISEQLQTLRSSIEKQYQLESKKLRNERDKISEAEMQFIDEISQLFKDKVTVGTRIKVTTQVGPNGGTILNTYTGKVTKIYNHSKPCFDLSDSSYMNGKEFTIGSSCIQSIELINQ